MFGHEYLDKPIVQVSIDGSLSPEKNWEIGSAVSKLRLAGRVWVTFCLLLIRRWHREEGYLILSGGLMIHNLRDPEAFAESAASPYKAWNDAVLLAASISEVRQFFLLYVRTY
jgi:aromatic ring-opening dioxygenase catalytic subunit (LigB family)